jgi:quercetin dioxygenase-like cupin family protein
VHRLTGGCLLVIPPHVTHYIDVQGDEEVLELDVFTPKRPEYGGGAQGG